MLVEQCLFLDTTLRDGEQASGVCFSLNDRVAIVQDLCALGVFNLEVRSPVQDPELLRESRHLMQQFKEVNWLFWCRAREEDLLAAKACGASRVHIAFPTSDVQLATIGRSWEDGLPELVSIVQLAKKWFSFVSVGAQDASRTSVERLCEFAHILCQYGVNRLRLADTLGIMLPNQVTDLVHAIKAQVNILLDFHAHNDIGLATANAVAANLAGCEVLSVTVMGLGERCGNAALEQVIMALHLHSPHSVNHLNLMHINSLCKTVAAAADRSIPLGQPLVGAAAYRHQSGIHIAGMLQNQSSYQPFHNSVIGVNAPEFELGAMAGKHALVHALDNLKQPHKVDIQGQEFDELLTLVRTLARKQKKAVNQEQLIELVELFTVH